jgi:hypothetical protein
MQNRQRSSTRHGCDEIGGHRTELLQDDGILEFARRRIAGAL